MLMDWDEMSNLYRGPSIEASYQVSVLLAGFRGIYLYRDFLHFEYRCLYLNKSYLSFNRKEDFFRNQPIRNKNCLWWPCLLTNWDKMSNLYRGPSIDTSYQVSVHFAKRFQRRRFFKIGQSETRIACGGHVC